MKYRNYYRPVTVKEALKLCGEDPGHSVIMAGATDIMVKARNRDWYENMDLVDISGIKALGEICGEKEFLRVGPMVTASMAAGSSLCRRYAPILATACENLGSPQIRNRATVGGNIANACIAGDCIPALTVMGGRIAVSSVHGERELPIEELVTPCRACLNHQEISAGSCFFGNPAGRKNSLRQGELITDILIPKRWEDYQICFQKIGRREGFCMSKFTLAVLLKMENRVVADLRIVLGSALAENKLQNQICGDLIGKTPDEADIKGAADRLAEKILTQGITNESILYKAEVCRRLCERTLTEMIRGETDEYKD